MVDYPSSRHKELSEQLATWWRAQTDFKTKKALADLIKVHPDTLGDYFSGRKFPKSDIAVRLCELTNMPCLRHQADANPLSDTVPQESSPVPLLLPAPSVAALTEKRPEANISGVTGPPQEHYRFGEIREAMAGQAPGELPKTGDRQRERSVIISLQRTNCPFCAHDVASFASCLYCGQHFVRANVPTEKGEA